MKVTGTVTLVREDASHSTRSDHSNAVVWIKPAKGSALEAPRPAPGQFEMRQQHKRFEPHVLAVPVGSKVTFPNLDPFFHNVFSMFDGKRFDLGLYESGTTRAATFDRAGVSYIFCNVHPEMSGVVITLDVPWYSVTDRTGEFTIGNVPPGQYLLFVWHERGKPEGGDEFPRMITVGSSETRLTPIRLRDSGQLVIPHKNKYGADYDPVPPVYR